MISLAAQLTLDVCRIDSTTGLEKGAVDFFELYLQGKGWKTERQPVGPEVGRDNLWAFSGDKNPDLIFCTHLDTVPPFIAPWIEGETVFGRGVCDAKGIAVCLAFAAEELKKEGVSIALLFVVGEETTSDGAKAAAQFGVKGKYVVVGEPTELKLIRAMKGVVAFELQAKGVTGHSAYPEKGHSAVHQLVDDLHNLSHLEWPKTANLGHTTCNIGVIQGGRAPNVIADEASSKGVIRATIQVEEIVQLIQSNIHPETKLNLLSCSDPQSLKVVDGFEIDIVSFGSDVPHLRPIGEPLLMGPGSILDAHTVHEQIEMDDLETAIQLYIQLGEKLVCN